MFQLPRLLLFRLVIISTFLLASRLVTPLNVFSQTDSPDNSTTVIPTIETSVISGQIQRVDGSTLTVEDDSGSRELSVPSNIKVTRNTFDASVSELQPGDRVTITTTSAGDILSVEAVSASTLDFTRIALPLLLVGLVAAGLLIYFINRSKKGTVKTQPPS